MEIERINENTIKFYISYVDIEERGFKREEIWNDRERSEQLFWMMMEEVNDKEDFVVEGPLWIQIQALEKGLEVVVTRSKTSRNGENMKLPFGNEHTLELPVDERIEEFLENKFSQDNKKDLADKSIVEENIPLIVTFDAFEDVIQLSHYFLEGTEGIKETLYYYDEKYRMLLEFEQDVMDGAKQEDVKSKVTEFATATNMSLSVLQVYGKKVMEEDVFNQIRSYFPNR